MAEEVDVVVIGMGPGGEAAARRLAAKGLSVVGVEARLLGGECPYYGCVPTKMMIRAADLLAEARRIPGMAGGVTVEADWTPVARRIRVEATDNWDDKVAVDRFVGDGGTFIRGRGHLTGPDEVTVDGRVFKARRAVLIAVGTEPAVPPVPGLADTPFWTNRDAVETERVPESLIVLGGGAIGVELAQTFARFGSRVSVVEVAERLLFMEEPEAATLLAEIFRREGVEVHTGAEVRQVTHDGREFIMTLADGQTLRARRLLVAAGRRTDLRRLGVGAAGLDENAKVIEVDGHMRAAPGVWAIGDVTGHGMFTHVSMYQAGIAVRDILGQDGPEAEYDAVPRVTFTDPEIGAVGLTEAQARERGLAVRTGTAGIGSSARGWIHRGEGLVKLVENAGTGLLVGATSMGPMGGEVLGALSVAVHGRVPTRRLRDMIYAYPTFHRAIEDALKDLGQP